MMIERGICKMASMVAATIAMSTTSPAMAGQTGVSMTSGQQVSVQQSKVRNLEQSIIKAPAKTLNMPTAEISKSAVNVPVKQVARTEPGKLYQVKTSAQQEKDITNILISQNAIRSQGDRIVPLPGVLRQEARLGGEVLLKPYVIPQRLREMEDGSFRGSIKVGVSEIAQNRPPRALSAPIIFEVLENGIADPVEVRVDRTGLPLKRINISVNNAPDGLPVTVASQFTPEGVPVTLSLPPMFRAFANSVVEGLGLEESEINFAVSGLDNVEGRLLRLSVDGPVRLTEQRLRFDDQGSASTTFRSTGVGQATIRANLPGFQKLEKSVHVGFPFLTIAASLLGGIVGGLIKILPTSELRTSRKMLAGLLVSVLTGALIFALYAVGVNLLPFTPTVTVGAVLVFAVSAVGAYFGTILLKPASNQT